MTDDTGVCESEAVYVMIRDNWEYHRPDCPFTMSRTDLRTTRGEARDHGLSPCPECYRDGDGE